MLLVYMEKRHGKDILDSACRVALENSWPGKEGDPTIEKTTKTSQTTFASKILHKAEGISIY